MFKEEEIERVSGRKLAELISFMRQGKLKIIPGYDGVYGKLVVEHKQQEKPENIRKLEDYF